MFGYSALHVRRLPLPPIRNRLLLVGVVVISAIAGASGLIVQMQREATIDAFRTATTNLAYGMSQQTAQKLAAADRALQAVRAAVAAAPTADGAPLGAVLPRRSTFDLLVAQRTGLAMLDALSLVDAAGRVVNTSGAWPAAGADVSGRDYFVHCRAIDDPAAYVGAPTRDPASGRWSVVMARRIDDSDGRFAGLVAAEISLTALAQFYQVAMPAHRSLYLLRRDGVILVRDPPAEREPGAKVPAQSPWYAAVAAGGGSYLAPAFFAPGRVIAAVQPLRDLPFVIEASVTQSDALAGWYRARIIIALGGVGAVICAVALLRLFAGQYRRLERSQRALAMRNAELDAAHRHLDAILGNLSQGVSCYDQDQTLLFCNRRYCEIYHLSTHAMRPGLTLRQVAELRVAGGSFGAGSVADYLTLMDTAIRAGQPSDRNVALADGRTMASHLQPLPGGGWVSTDEDITQRCEAEAKIVFLSRHDALTGLANRTLFGERLEQALALAERGRGFALLCLDLDGFKAVNDAHGHAIGDALLCAVADRLLDAARDSDTVARLGGDEFAILQTGVSKLAETTAFARRLVQSITRPFALDGQSVMVGASIGIAMAPGDSAHPMQLLKYADLALYRAKQEGRGTWRYFEPALAQGKAKGLRPLDPSWG